MKKHAIITNFIARIHFLTIYIILLSIAFPHQQHSQNENSKWYFGYSAGVDLLTNPPLSLNNGKTHTPEGGASIADSVGNLLFYTSADTIWNKAHVIMANGTGLMGHQSSSQSALIIRKPGSSTLYYVFTTDSGISVNGLRYSIVDMSLAAGMGSVTVKNILLYKPCAEKLAGTMHCNGRDVWIVSHGLNNNQFKSYLLSTNGLNNTPVISPVGTSNGWNPGQMKISPTGKKLAVAYCLSSPAQLFDFDNSTGIVSNSLVLVPSNDFNSYGLEFSQDGSKLYCSGGNTTTDFNQIVQWDLCAGNSQAIQNSRQIIFFPNTVNPPQLIGSLQLSPDGKIYVARGNNMSILSQVNRFLGAINNPNAAGISCNYTDSVINLNPGFSFLSLPGMVYKRQGTTSPFSFAADSLSCLTVSFTAPVLQGNSSPSACSSLGYSLTGIIWDFGDPMSQNNNSSNISNPTHTFTGFGNYTVQLKVLYSCGGGTQTISQVINVGPPPILTVFNPTICTNESINLIANGANSYTWNNTSNSPTLTVSPSVTTVYSLTGESAPNICKAKSTVTVTVSECLKLNTYLPSSDLFNIYPNPATNLLTIESAHSGFMIVYSSFGLKIIETDVEKGSNHIQLTDFQPGVYFVDYFQKSGRGTLKFVVFK
ncbi:MAG: PKD domain-containing protein [Bacteroidia bacterium]|jgi:PKD repeat protein|nr:PKD domain-containing protein [Bacteroidia bacterium]